MPDISPLMPMHQDPLLVSYVAQPWCDHWWWADTHHDAYSTRKDRNLSTAQDRPCLGQWKDVSSPCCSTEDRVPMNYINRHRWLKGPVITLRPRQSGRHFAGDILNAFFLNETLRTLIWITLKFVPNDPINDNPSLIEIMAWRRTGDKPFSETMTV